MKHQNLNTSYVTVLHRNKVSRNRNRRKFKYILCYGSTLDIPRLLLGAEHLNTSYVTVLRQLEKLVEECAEYLNTSYVTVLRRS